ncbi:hypothetical protein [Nocardioides sp. 503]|uniref:hypothetical protein n=1 Tax=Nocardioides sp. 503 TaxID=2508326 RepID=UPI00106FE79F|nr:hypothetical protein [Nocardioides sp. 503]
MRRSPVSALSLLAVCSLVGSLAGCSLIPGSSSDLEDALEVVPADATSVTFVGRAAIAERLDVEVETGADDRELGRYLQAVDEAGVATRLTSYLGVMGDAALSDADIVWEVSGSGQDDEGLWTVWKTDDDLDLDEVGDDLVDAGYDESETGGERRFRAELAAADPETSLVGDRYPVAVMGDVVLVPDEHLVLTGPAVEATLDVVQDDEDSLVDGQDFEDVVNAVDDAEFAHLRRDIDCGAVQGRRSPPTPDPTLEGLARPEATGFFVHGDDAETTTVLAFEDDDTAEADAEARGAWLEDGLLLQSQRPVADVATWDIEHDGSLVRIDEDLKGGVRFGIELALADDGFTRCAPEG